MSVITISEGQHLAEAIELLFTSDVPGWFTPFVTVLDGLTAAQATAVPAERFNSVWGVTNHLRFFQEVALRQLQGVSVDYTELGSPDGSGWPAGVDGDD
ncbi:MAG TPA: DinB family protein, partial [Phototrophicaceae bacterium]|nr:DinB family protein [Phototrophicaceae bacterium]